MPPVSAAQSRAAELDQRIEHSLQVERRAADDLEDIGGSGLLFQCFGEVGGALGEVCRALAQLI